MTGGTGGTSFSNSGGNGSAAGAGLFLNGGTVNMTVGSANTNTISGDIADAGQESTANQGAITKTGVGTLVLSGDSSGQYGYSGGTTVQAGTLQAANNGALGHGGVTVNNGATLNVINGITINNAAKLNGGTLQGTGTAAVSGNVTWGPAAFSMPPPAVTS
ncbi:MAG: autotransporter-associated beta strand repeat-containing protein [Candidatus Methylumidiphilus sp.]